MSDTSPDGGSTHSRWVILGLKKSALWDVLRQLRESAEQTNEPEIKYLESNRDGRMKPPPAIVVRSVDAWISDVEPGLVSFLVLPGITLASSVRDWLQVFADTYGDEGARVVFAEWGTNGWPTEPERESGSQTLIDCVARELTPSVPRDHEPVAQDIVRGLATHTKFSEVNHSHEDDVWKTRGQNLSPGDRSRIMANLLRSGILSRKKNRSAGGTGWVYWIGDVGLARTRFPELAPYLGARGP